MKTTLYLDYKQHIKNELEVYRKEKEKEMGYDYLRSGRSDTIPVEGYHDPQTDEFIQTYTYPKDPIIEKVLNRIADRADTGMNKYETSMEDNDGGVVYWLDHAIEEALDLAAYLTKLKTVFEGDK